MKALERDAIVQCDVTRQILVEDLYDCIIVLGKMVQQHRICSPTVVVRLYGRLFGDGMKELVLVREFDELHPLLDRPLLASSVCTNVAQQFGELAGCEDELPQSIVADLELGRTDWVGKITVETYKGEIIYCCLCVRGAEIGGIVTNHPREVDPFFAIYAQGEQLQSHWIVRRPQ